MNDELQNRPPPHDTDLRITALEHAMKLGQSSAHHVAEDAKVFLAFLKGEVLPDPERARASPEDTRKYLRVPGGGY